MKNYTPNPKNKDIFRDPRLLKPQISFICQCGPKYDFTASFKNVYVLLLLRFTLVSMGRELDFVLVLWGSEQMKHSASSVRQDRSLHSGIFDNISLLIPPTKNALLFLFSMFGCQMDRFDHRFRLIN